VPISSADHRDAGVTAKQSKWLQFEPVRGEVREVLIERSQIQSGAAREIDGSKP
jgi:hypothetical protein